jgi:CHASE2 domain-containing sensor protein
MHPLLGLLLILLAAGAFVAFAYWLERRLRQPGLGVLLGAAAMLAGSALGFVAGQRLLPSLFILQALGFLYSARWRRSEARKASTGAAEA